MANITVNISSNHGKAITMPNISTEKPAAELRHVCDSRAPQYTAKANDAPSTPTINQRGRTTHMVPNILGMRALSKL